MLVSFLTDERISSGIPGFDELIGGGIPKGHLILVAGTPGTGKSILCAQVAYHNALKGKKCLYLNLEQDSGRLPRQMLQFGWDVAKVSKNLKIVEVDTTEPKMLEYVLSEIQKLNYDIILLDSLDSISTVSVEPGEFEKLSAVQVAKSVIPTIIDQPTIGRLKLKQIFNAITKSKATAILTSERVENSPGITRDTISEFLCDGIITMFYVGVGAIDFRSMRILKMRSSDHFKDYILFNISKNGVEIVEDPLSKNK